MERMETGPAETVRRAAAGDAAEIHGDEVVAVYVDPDGRGLGDALLAATEAEARRQDVERLHVLATLNAVPFYERHGYQRVKRMKVPLPPGQELAAWKMEKPLAGQS